MLEVKKLQTGYGKKKIIFDVSMTVEKGSIVGIIGPNGAGKSTILKAICGVIPAWQGDIIFKEDSIINNQIAENIKLGITYAPQGSRIFEDLKVKDNLELGGYLLKQDRLQERIEAVYTIFPVLKKRNNQIAGKLSGGERQMLALARVLIPEPDLLLLDEPSLGLAPNLLNDVFDKLVEINRLYGVTMLIVEQKVNEILKISDKIYSIKLGKIEFEGISQELIDNKNKIKDLFI